MQVSLPRLKAMTWKMANQNAESDHAAVISLKVLEHFLGHIHEFLAFFIEFFDIKDKKKKK